MAGQLVPAQSARRPTAPKGPRALGLVELASNGNARLIPVMIMDDGKFYDASAYKASPVPMALETETVYEGVRTGVSQGLFTVIKARQVKNTWIGEGFWESAIAVSAKSQKSTAPSKPHDDDLDVPPVLRRPSPDKPKPLEPAPPQTPSPSATPAPATKSVPTPPSPGAGDRSAEDKDRPTLRRGKPSSPAAGTSAKSPLPATASFADVGALQIIPAISDAGGADFRPYVYKLKPEEEQQFRKKILALAADEVRARVRQLAADTVAPAPPARGSARPTKAAKLPQPSIEDIQFRVFDLSNSNEPVLVLTAKARMPQTSGASGAELQYYVTLVARENIYGELHKAFSDVTDTRHLDVLPRFELIDAVDADGDGRAELLFRQTSDAGTAFVIYRVIGNQLWPLFQGTPPGH